MGGATKGTVVQAPPQPAAPSAGESAGQLAQTRLQYDPQIAAMEQSLQQQYYPQQAALEASLYKQYAPQMAQSQEDLRRQFSPLQSELTDVFAQQAIQRLQDPYGETPEQSAATQAIRERAVEGQQRAMRERANLGGNLYGGRAANAEQEATSQMMQQFASQDIGRQQQGAQTALQYATPVLQQLYPQVQFPGGPQTQAPVQQPVTPGADTLYNAMFQAGRPTYFQEGPGGTNLGILGQWGRY